MCGTTTTTGTNKYSNMYIDYTDDYCDCDERCPRCGKKKRRKFPYNPYKITCEHDTSRVGTITRSVRY